MQQETWSQCLLGLSIPPPLLTIDCQLCRLRGSMQGRVVLEGSVAEIESFIRHMGFHEEESGFNLKEKETVSLQRKGLSTHSSA